MFFSVYPNENSGFNGGWTCKFGDVSNSPGAGSDAQVHCGWNQTTDPHYNPLRPGLTLGMESFCDIGVGCTQTGPQAEWYYIFTPPVISAPSAWQSNHVYLQGDFIAGVDSNQYICMTSGTSKASGSGPNNPTDPEVPDIVDGTVHWTRYAGMRWTTLNGRVNDGYGIVGFAGSSVGIGNGHSTNSATMITATNGTAVFRSYDGSNVITIPPQSNDEGTLAWPGTYTQAMAFSPDATGAPSFEMSGMRAALDGNVGFGIRAPITCNTGDGPLGGNCDLFTNSLRGGGAYFKSITVHQATVPTFSGSGINSGQHMTWVETDGTRGDQLRAAIQTTVAQNGGFGGGVVYLPNYDVFGEDTCQRTTAGTSTCGNEFCSRFAAHVGGNDHTGATSFKVDFLVWDIVTLANMAFVEVVGTLDAINVLHGVATVFDHGNLGVNYSFDMVAGADNGCVQPRIITSDATHYGVKWTAVGNASTY